MESKLDQIIGKALWAIITATVMYGVNELKEMRVSLEKLNINIAVIITEQNYLKKQIYSHDVKIQKLENRTQ